MKLRQRVARVLRRSMLSPPPPAPLSADADAILASMYASQPQRGEGDLLYPIDSGTRITRDRGDLLYAYAREVKPALSIEVGLAYGFSTLFLLSALRDQGSGHVIAIDPHQSSSWHGVGAARARQLGLEDRFTLIEERSEHALPRLALEGCEAQLIFIDGDHRFDATLLDFTLCDRLLPVGGIVALDDLWMPSVRRVASFVAHNRADYERLPDRVLDIAAFRKIRAADERPWHHYVDF
jgi:predicted O-methyltransferase YrrM